MPTAEAAQAHSPQPKERNMAINVVQNQKEGIGKRTRNPPRAARPERRRRHFDVLKFKHLEAQQPKASCVCRDGGCRQFPSSASEIAASR
jgi:hypothetical protein